MTDFLQRISQTALGLTPSVQPLVVSHYARHQHQPVVEVQPPVASSAETRAATAPESGAPYAPAAISVPLVAQTRTGKSAAPAHAVEDPLRETGMAPVTGNIVTPARSTEALPVAAAPWQEFSPIERREPDSRVDADGAATENEIARPVTARPGLRPDFVEPLSIPVLARGAPAPGREKGVGAETGGGRMEASKALLHEDARVREDGRSLKAVPVVIRAGNRRDLVDGVAEAGRMLVAGRDLAAGRSIEASASGTDSISGRGPEPFRMSARSITPRSERAESRQSIVGEEAPRCASPVRATPDSSSPPVIRVTIGRIEVRAVMPPMSPPAEVSAPPAPKLSLDEYLRQHNGRRR